MFFLLIFACMSSQKAYVAHSKIVILDDVNRSQEIALEAKEELVYSATDWWELLPILRNLTEKKKWDPQKIDIDISGFDLSKHILIYGPKFMENGTFLNIKKMYDIFGKKYTKGNIIFYNQDWYLSEKFAKTTLNNKWYLVQKEVSNKSRGSVPKNQFKILQ